MTAATLTPLDLGSVRCQYLDCIQSNLAVLAEGLAPGRHLALGAALRFDPRPMDGGLRTVEPPLREQLPAAAAQLGLTPVEIHRAVPASALRQIAERAGRAYVVADAYAMPWLPYFGQRHMDHSFLVEPDGDGASVVDAYDNQTAWGPARPGRWFQRWSDLPAALVAIVYAPGASYHDPYPTVDIGDWRDYVSCYARHSDRVAAMEQLAVETWLLSRSRQLHADYRRSRGEALTPADTAHLQQWERVAATAFIALRRAQRGKPEPATLLDDLGAALDADRTVFTDRTVFSDHAVFANPGVDAVPAKETS